MGCARRVGKTCECLIKTITFICSAIMVGVCGFLIYEIVHTGQNHLLFVPCATLAVTAFVCIAICSKNDCLYKIALAALIVNFLLGIAGFVFVYLLTHTKLGDDPSINAESRQMINKLNEEQFEKKGYIGIGIQLGIQLVYIVLVIISCKADQDDD